eukprot:g4735.t1
MLSVPILAAFFAGALLVPLLAYLIVRFQFSASPPKFPVPTSSSSSGVVVTGASRGIGKACAFHLASLGYTVFAGVRKDSDGKALLKESKSSKGEIVPLKLDVTSESSISAAVASVAARAPGVVLVALVNNAGVNVGPYPVEYLPADALRRQLEINVIGQVAVTKGFLPLLRSSGAGSRVIFMSSVAGSISSAFGGAYASSKFAVEAIADALRRELLPWKMSVSVVKPSELASDLLDKYQEDGKRVLDDLPADGRRRYGVWYENMKPTRAKYVGKVAQASEAVAHAIGSSRPKTRYVVGSKAMVKSHLYPMSFLGITMPVWSLLPDSFLDKQMKRSVWPKRYAIGK